MISLLLYDLVGSKTLVFLLVLSQYALFFGCHSLSLCLSVSSLKFWNDILFCANAKIYSGSNSTFMRELWIISLVGVRNVIMVLVYVKKLILSLR